MESLTMKNINCFKPITYLQISCSYLYLISPNVEYYHLPVKLGLVFCAVLINNNHCQQSISNLYQKKAIMMPEFTVKAQEQVGVPKAEEHFFDQPLNMNLDIFPSEEIKGEESTMKVWTDRERELLVHFFVNQGSKWNYISYYFPGRSKVFIKNQFYNSMRKAARKMSEIQRIHFRNFQNKINVWMLMNVFHMHYHIRTKHPELINRVEQTVGLTSLFKQILEYAFHIEQAEEEQAMRITKKIRHLNGTIRCFGIFKTKDMKRWKLSEAGVQYLAGLKQKSSQQQINQKIQQF